MRFQQITRALRLHLPLFVGAVCSASSADAQDYTMTPVSAGTPGYAMTGAYTGSTSDYGDWYDDGRRDGFFTRLFYKHRVPFRPAVLCGGWSKRREFPITSPICSPTHGYFETCWGRFPPTDRCCPTGDFMLTGWETQNMNLQTPANLPPAPALNPSTAPMPNALPPSYE